MKLRDILLITIGTALMAFAVASVFDPASLVTGGFSGLAIIIRQLTEKLVPGGVPLSVTNLILNVPFLLLAVKLKGFRYLLRTGFATVMLSFWLSVLPVIPIAEGDLLLSALYGGLIMGAGIGLVFVVQATTGGTDIVARLLKLKFPWLPMGKLILIPDGVVLALTAIAFQRLETALYGAVALYVSSKVMDTVLYGLNASKVAYIISNHWQKISDAILAYDRGVTILNATGAYSGSEKHVLMVAFRQREIVEIKEIVHEADPAAFLIVCDAHDVLGEGFGEYQKEL